MNTDRKSEGTKMTARSGTLRKPPADPPLAEVVSLSVRRRCWHKPLPAIIADAIANSQALLTRLDRGLYCPDLDDKPYYKACLTEVCLRTREQLAALEAFTAIEWRE